MSILATHTEDRYGKMEAWMVGQKVSTEIFSDVEIVEILDFNGTIFFQLRHTKNYGDGFCASGLSLTPAHDCWKA